MFRFRVAFILAGASFLLFPGGAQHKGSVSVLVSPPGFDLAHEMTVLYGNFDPATETSSITVPKNFSYNETAKVRAFFLSDFQDSASTQVFLATFAVPAIPDNNYGCNACMPLIGEALFREDVAGWALEASRKPNLVFGCCGVPPNARIFQFGPHRFGVELRYGASAQGVTSEDTVFLVPWNGQFSTALRVFDCYDNVDDCVPLAAHPVNGLMTICHALASSMRLVPGANPEYYDILIKTWPTKPKLKARDDLGDLVGTRRLRFVDGKYF